MVAESAAVAAWSRSAASRPAVCTAVAWRAASASTRSLASRNTQTVPTIWARRSSGAQVYSTGKLVPFRRQNTSPVTVRERPSTAAAQIGHSLWG
jgi:hypothetical protein